METLLSEQNHEKPEKKTRLLICHMCAISDGGKRRRRRMTRRESKTDKGEDEGMAVAAQVGVKVRG